MHISMYQIFGENEILTKVEVSNGMSISDVTTAGLPTELCTTDVCTVWADARLDSCFLEGYNDVGHGAWIGKGARREGFAPLRPNRWLPDGTQVLKSKSLGWLTSYKKSDSFETKIMFQEETPLLRRVQTPLLTPMQSFPLRLFTRKKIHYRKTSFREGPSVLNCFWAT